MSLDDLIDGAWFSMRGSLFRRAILGKQRCAQLVMMALAYWPSGELTASERNDIAMLVEAKYRQQVGQVRDTYNAVFMTVVLTWAIRLIVAWLVKQAVSEKFDIDDIRKQYGWKPK